MDKQSIKLYNILKDEIDYIIKRIKKRPQTTKNNYGDYSGIDHDGVFINEKE